MIKFIAILFCPCLLFAGLNVNVNVGMPTATVVVEEPEITFDVQPQIVQVNPGIYIVPDNDVEIFVVSGVYWTKHRGHWYRCNGPRKHWVRTKYAPRKIAHLPPGKYKHWHQKQEYRHEGKRHDNGRHEGHYKHNERKHD